MKKDLIGYITLAAINTITLYFHYRLIQLIATLYLGAGPIEQNELYIQSWQRFGLASLTSLLVSAFLLFINLLINKFLIKKAKKYFIFLSILTFVLLIIVSAGLSYKFYTTGL